MKEVKQEQNQLASNELSELVLACEGDPGAIYRLESRHSLLPWEETKKLFERVAQGDEKARERIIVHNLRLVFPVARKYRFSGPPWLDLVQAGNESLILAVDGFDLKFGFQFSTYATKAIEGGVFAEIVKARMVKVPQNIRSAVRMIRAVEKKLRSMLGREPTNEEIKQAAQLDEDEWHEARSAMKSILSLDVPLTEAGDGDMTSLDLLESSNEGSEELLEQTQYVALLETLFNKLSEAERDVIERRYGLNGNDPQEVRAIAEALGLPIPTTRTRLRKAEQKLKYYGRRL